MAEPAVDLIDELTRLDPRTAASLVLRAGRDDGDWLDAFADQLDRQRNATALRRVLRTWDLNQSDAARIFGVSRQAMSKWLQQGVPAERATAVADLAAATDLLTHHLKRERISAVVRRPAPALQDQSLLALLERRRFPAVLQACREMFEFAEAHP